MKKLLSLTNLIFFVLVLAACQNTAISEKRKSSIANTGVEDSIGIKETSKANNKAVHSLTVGTGKGIKKDTNDKQFKGNGNAIIHHAPYQHKIDSIKDSKMKWKK